MALTELLGDVLLTKEGEKPTEEALSGCEAVGLYFSAHWCPPCRGFTPELAKRYTSAYQGKGMKIVFVSSDRDESSFNEYFGEMPWLALPFSKSEIKQKLSSKYSVSGIPTLVILKPDGSLITSDGRTCTTKDPTGEHFPWSDGPQAIGAGSGGGGLARGQTEQIVDAFKAKQKPMMHHQMIQVFVSVIFCALYWWFWSEAAEECKSEPIAMKSVFLSFGIVSAFLTLSSIVALCSLRKVMNDHMVKASIYQAQGRDKEAENEAHAGMSEGGICLKIIACQGILMGCVGCFMIVWSIICLVSAINGSNDTNKPFCEDETKRYWGIFVSSFIVQCCMSVRQGAIQRKSGLQ